MSKRIARPHRAGPIAPSVVHLAAVADSAIAGARRGRDAGALRALGRIARVAVPAQGVLFPLENDLTVAIDDVARRHLGQGKADRRFRAALRKVQTFGDRDAIETAHAESLQRTATTYYYAGLAWGLTYVEPGRQF